MTMDLGKVRHVLLSGRGCAAFLVVARRNEGGYFVIRRMANGHFGQTALDVAAVLLDKWETHDGLFCDRPVRNRFDP